MPIVLENPNREEMDETRYKLVPGENNNASQKSSLGYEKPSSKGLFAQCLLTAVVMLSSAGCGMPIGYSAILLPQLKATNGTMKIDENLGSWIASMHSAATPLGSFMSGILMDYYGRKVAVQISSLPLIIGWLLIAFCHNHILLIAGRVIAGISVGLIAAPGQVLLGEISEPHLRGVLTSVPFGSYSFGILLVYALGTFLEWRIVAGLSTILPIIAAVIFFFLPESPVWLLRKGRNDEAKLSLSWFRGGDVIKTKMEMHQLVTRVEQEFLEKSQNKKSLLRILSEPRILKPFILLNVFSAAGTFCGTYLVVFYAVDIISSMKSGAEIDPFLAAILTACVRFMFTIVASVLLGLIGRRTLALISGMGTAVSAITLGIFLMLPQETSFYSYIPAICILLYVAFNTIGFMILPGVMLGELYPANVRGLLGGLTFMIFHIMTFGTAKAFPAMTLGLGTHGIFIMFGIVAAIGFVYVYIMLPETKGRTLHQIEDYFAQSNITWAFRNKKLDCQYNNNNETEKV